MGQDSQRFLTMAMYRRWAYMVVAILVSTWLLDATVFNFEDDKGILYIRSFDMNQEEFVVTQTELDTGLSHPWVCEGLVLPRQSDAMGLYRLSALFFQ